MNVGPLVILLPILTVLSIGLLGTTRRIGFLWAILASLFLTPIGGLILCLLSGPRRRQRSGATHGKDKSEPEGRR